MGLDISPGDAQWSYGGFARFREALAAEDGIDLTTMYGFTPGGRPWDTVESTLVPLLSHSDCDGFIDPFDCEDMLPRLREVRDKWRDAESLDALRDYNVQQLGALITGMEHCVEHGCAVVFR